MGVGFFCLMMENDVVAVKIFCSEPVICLAC